MVKIITFNDRTVRHVRSMPDGSVILKLYERRPTGRARHLCVSLAQCVAGRGIYLLERTDIDWQRNRFTIYSSKTEHHVGRRCRVVPISPALRPYLERAYRERHPGEEHVVDAWMGNSSRIRRRHYLKVTEADFERAAAYPAHYRAHSAAFRSVQEPSTLHDDREKSLDVVKDAETQYPRQGSNL